MFIIENARSKKQKTPELFLIEWNLVLRTELWNPIFPELSSQLLGPHSSVPYIMSDSLPQQARRSAQLSLSRSRLRFSNGWMGPFLKYTVVCGFRG